MSKWTRMTMPLKVASCALLSGLSCGGDTTEPSTTGMLRVTVTTSGSFLPDGYEINIDAIGPNHPLETTGFVEIAGLTPGDHSVWLFGLPSNCSIEGGDRRDITITAGVLIGLAYTVSCVTPATFSTLIIETLTVGVGSDPDGYTVQIDDGEPQVIGIPGQQGSASLTVPGRLPACTRCPSLA